MFPDDTSTAAVRPRILVVDDDPAMLRLLDRQLAAAGHEVITASDGQMALRVLLEEGPQVVITDWVMPKLDGIELCRTIRELGECGFVYIIVLTALSDKRRLIEAFEAGADDFLCKPVHEEELLARLKAGLRIVHLEADLARKHMDLHKANAELAVLNERLDRQAATDDLTGLLNRREAMRRLAEQWASAQRHDQPLSCAILDLDHFKRINDTHGHGVGDAVLRHTAGVLRRMVRGGEPICRLGGEEFLLICPLCGSEQARVAAERLRQAVAEAVYDDGTRRLQVTLSAGVATGDGGMRNWEDLLRRADEALYEAKRCGRNRVGVTAATPAGGD